MQLIETMRATSDDSPAFNRNNFALRCDFRYALKVSLLCNYNNYKISVKPQIARHYLTN